MTWSPRSRARSHPPRRAAFTLVELITVITIILLLVGLIIGASGFANNKALRSRATSEIKAISTAAENYKSDNGVYPRSTNTDALDARTQADPSINNKALYTSASRDLYALLSGQFKTDANGVSTLDTNPKYPRPVTSPPNPLPNYWGELKPNMLSGVTNGSGTVTAINDPWTMSYGFSTAYTADAEANTSKPNYQPGKGYNPTFDLWSVANKVSSSSTASVLDSTVRPVWIINW